MGKRQVLLAVCILVSAMVLGACGSSKKASTTGSSASSTGGAAAAKQLVSAAEQPPTWQGPTGKVDIAKAKGKQVYFINLTEQIPALHEWGVVMTQQLKLAGVSTQTCDAKGSPNGITTCLQQAIAAHPAAIVALALDTTFIASFIARAKAAGIKFITGQTGTPGVPTVPGDLAEVTFDYPAVGRTLGDWFVADSGCTKGPAQIITSTSSRQPSAAEVTGIQGEVKRLCPSLKLPVENVLIPDWPIKLSTTTRSILLQDPSLQYILPLYDGMTIYMSPIVAGLHRSNPVKLASFNGTPVVMQQELAKPSPLAADIGGPNQWYGVALADQVLRVVSGGQVVANEKVPLRLFTRHNVSSIDVSKDESTWYGAVNPIAKYHKLWGLAG